MFESDVLPNITTILLMNAINILKFRFVITPMLNISQENEHK